MGSSWRNFDKPLESIHNGEVIRNQVKIQSIEPITAVSIPSICLVIGWFVRVRPLLLGVGGGEPGVHLGSPECDTPRFANRNKTSYSLQSAVSSWS